MVFEYMLFLAWSPLLIVNFHGDAYVGLRNDRLKCLC